MSASDLDVLAPQPQVVDLAGQRLAISPLVLGERDPVPDGTPAGTMIWRTRA